MGRFNAPSFLLRGFSDEKMPVIVEWYKKSNEEEAKAYLKKKNSDVVKILIEKNTKSSIKNIAFLLEKGIVSATAMDKAAAFDYTRSLKKKKKKMPIFENWFINQENEKATELFKKSCKKTVCTLIDNDDIPTLYKIRDLGYFTKKNIDTFISYANENGKTEIAVILMNYKNEHLGFEDNLNKLLLK